MNRVESVIISEEVNFLLAQDFVLQPLVAGYCFFPSELGAFATQAQGVVATPVIRFGDGTDFGKILSPINADDLTAVRKQERFISLDSNEGVLQITAGITVPAQATTLRGFFYVRGFFFPLS